MLCDTSEGVKCFLLKLIWGTLTLTLNIPLHSTKAFIKVTINREKELLDSQFYNKEYDYLRKDFSDKDKTSKLPLYAQMI